MTNSFLMAFFETLIFSVCGGILLGTAMISSVIVFFVVSDHVKQYVTQQGAKTHIFMGWFVGGWFAAITISQSMSWLGSLQNYIRN